jgi:hypothetical protein
LSHKDGEFRLGRAAASFGENAGDEVTAFAQAVGKGGFSKGINAIGEVGNAMPDLGCHFPYLKVFKSKVSHGEGTIGKSCF